LTKPQFHDDEDPWLQASEVAPLLRVKSPKTVTRYATVGVVVNGERFILRSEKTAGQHRRYRLAWVREFDQATTGHIPDDAEVVPLNRKTG
jgi:hypothetical protein